MADKVTAPLVPSVEAGSENSLASTLSEVLRCHDIKQHSTVPAQVVSYDRKSHRATVKILVKKAFTTTNGIQYLDWPEFTVPVLLKQTGMMLVDMPIYPGDTGYVVAGHRDGNTAIEKNSGITDAPKTKSSASSSNNKSASSGGGTSVTTEELENLTATVDVDKFAESPIGSASGTYSFVYRSSNWYLNNVTAVELSEYGITVNGTPYNGAKIRMVYTAPVGGAGASVQLTVTQGIKDSDASYSYSTPTSSGSSSLSSAKLSTGAKLAKALKGTNNALRSLLGTNGDKTTLEGTSADDTSLVGTNTDRRTLLGTDSVSSIKTVKTLKTAGRDNLKNKIRMLLDKTISVLKGTSKEIKETNAEENAKASVSSSSSSNENTTSSSEKQNDQVSENTENAGSQPPDTFAMHRYENGYFVPCRWGDITLDAEDEFNLVIGNTRRVEDGTDEYGKTRYKQEVFGKLTISRAGKIVSDAPAGMEIRSDVDIMGQLVIDGGLTAVENSTFGASIGVAGAAVVDDDVDVGGDLTVDGDASVEQSLTVGKSYRKAIIDPHQDLRDGAANDTARFRPVNMVTGIRSDNDVRTVFNTREVYALATKGTEKPISVAKPIVEIKQGKNITIDKVKSGNKTVYTINGTAEVYSDDLSTHFWEDSGTNKLSLKNWHDDTAIASTAIEDAASEGYEKSQIQLVARVGENERELKYFKVRNAFDNGLFKLIYNGNDAKITNCYFYWHEELVTPDKIDGLDGDGNFDAPANGYVYLIGRQDSPLVSDPNPDWKWKVGTNKEDAESGGKVLNFLLYVFENGSPLIDYRSTFMSLEDDTQQAEIIIKTPSGKPTITINASDGSDSITDATVSVSNGNGKSIVLSTKDIPDSGSCGGTLQVHSFKYKDSSGETQEYHGIFCQDIDITETDAKYAADEESISLQTVTTELGSSTDTGNYFQLKGFGKFDGGSAGTYLQSGTTELSVGGEESTFACVVRNGSSETGNTISYQKIRIVSKGDNGASSPFAFEEYEEEDTTTKEKIKKQKLVNCTVVWQNEFSDTINTQTINGGTYQIASGTENIYLIGTQPAPSESSPNPSWNWTIDDKSASESTTDGSKVLNYQLYALSDGKPTVDYRTTFMVLGIHSQEAKVVVKKKGTEGETVPTITADASSDTGNVTVAVGDDTKVAIAVASENASVTVGNAEKSITLTTENLASSLATHSITYPTGSQTETKTVYGLFSEDFSLESIRGQKGSDGTSVEYVTSSHGETSGKENYTTVHLWGKKPASSGELPSEEIGSFDVPDGLSVASAEVTKTEASAEYTYTTIQFYDTEKATLGEPVVISAKNGASGSDGRSVASATAETVSDSGSYTITPVTFKDASGSTISTVNISAKNGGVVNADWTASSGQAGFIENKPSICYFSIGSASSYPTGFYGNGDITLNVTQKQLAEGDNIHLSESNNVITISSTGGGGSSETSGFTGTLTVVGEVDYSHPNLRGCYYALKFENGVLTDDPEYKGWQIITTAVKESV